MFILLHRTNNLHHEQYMLLNTLTNPLIKTRNLVWQRSNLIFILQKVMIMLRIQKINCKNSFCLIFYRMDKTDIFGLIESLENILMFQTVNVNYVYGPFHIQQSNCDNIFLIFHPTISIQQIQPQQYFKVIMF